MVCVVNVQFFSFLSHDVISSSSNEIKTSFPFNIDCVGVIFAFRFEFLLISGNKILTLGLGPFWDIDLIFK